MDEPNQRSHVEKIRRYYESLGLPRVEIFTDIHQGDILAEFIQQLSNVYCDFYVGVARKLTEDRGKPCWSMGGKYAWAWVPSSVEEAPGVSICFANMFDLNESRLREIPVLKIPKESLVGRAVSEIWE